MKKVKKMNARAASWSQQKEVSMYQLWKLLDNKGKFIEEKKNSQIESPYQYKSSSSVSNEKV